MQQAHRQGVPMNAKPWRWLKAPVSRLDDPRWGKLSDHFYRRLHEFYYFAGRVGDNGRLPPVDDMAWTLRSDAEAVQEDLAALAEQGYLSNRSGSWYVNEFEESQAPEDRTGAERKRRQRARENAERDVTRDVTVPSRVELEIEKEIETEQEQDQYSRTEGAALAAFWKMTKDRHFWLTDEKGNVVDRTTKVEAMRYPEWPRQGR